MKILLVLLLSFSFIGCGVCISGRTVKNECRPKHRIHKNIKMHKFYHKRFSIDVHKMYKNKKIQENKIDRLNKDRKFGVHRERMNNQRDKIEIKREELRNNINEIKRDVNKYKMRRDNSYGNEGKRIHQEKKKEEKRNTRQDKKF